MGGLVDPADLGQDDDEFVAAQTADRVGAAYAAGQALGHFLQYRVADGMAEAVVDALEAVEVDKHHGHLAMLAPRRRQRLLQAVEKQHPVGQVGQVIVLGQMTGARLGLLALGDVGQHHHIVGDLAQRIADAGVGHPQRQLGVIFAQADNFAFPMVAQRHLRPDLIDAGVVQGRAQRRQWRAHHAVGCLAGHVDIRLIDGQHNMRAVGHQNGVAATAEHPGGNCHHVFCLLAFGNVAQYRVRQHLVVQGHRGEQDLGPEALAVRQLIQPLVAAVSFDQVLRVIGRVGHQRGLARRLRGRRKIEQGLARQRAVGRMGWLGAVAGICRRRGRLRVDPEQRQRGRVGVDDGVVFDQHDGVVGALKQFAEIDARLQQGRFVHFARADVDLHTKHLLRDAVALDREMGRVHPALATVAALDVPVARQRRAAAVPHALQGTGELVLIFHARGQAGERLPQRLGRRNPKQLLATLVPETHDAVLVNAVHGHRGRQVQRSNNPVQNVDRLAARAVRLGRDGKRMGIVHV